MRDQRGMLISHPLRGSHRGQRSYGRTPKAGHMTAPFPIRNAPNKCLASRAVPHMGLADVWNAVFCCGA